MSAIEWTSITWNPVTGCDKVSPGCKHCYAERMATRLKAMGVPGYERGFALTCHPSRLGDPARWPRPRGQKFVFVCSMSDLFHEAVPDDFIYRVIDAIAARPDYTFQVLTKRAHRAAALLDEVAGKPPTNLWVGFSAENRRRWEERVQWMEMVDAQVRFVSAEPLLGPLDLRASDLEHVDWLILGGESGPGARPMDPAWARQIRNACRAADTAFFLKQWGAWGEDGVRRSKSKNGASLDGETWHQWPTPDPDRGW